MNTTNHYKLELIAAAQNLFQIAEIGSAAIVGVAPRRVHLRVVGHQCSACGHRRPRRCGHVAGWRPHRRLRVSNGGAVRRFAAARRASARAGALRAVCATVAVNRPRQLAPPPKSTRADEGKAVMICLALYSMLAGASTRRERSYN